MERPYYTLKYKNNGLNFLKNYVYVHNPLNKVSEKEQYTLHSITHLRLVTRAFCHTCVQNLLKVIISPKYMHKQW